MAQVISVVSLKGGSGKTMSTLYIAALLQYLNRPACVVDFDNQATAVSWSLQAGNDLGFPVYPARDLQVGLNSEREVVIDTPPNDPKTLGMAARASDKVVVVCGGNFLDVDRLGPTLEVLRGSGFEGPWKILLTRVDRGGLGRSVKETLEEGGYPVAGMIPTLLEYQRSFGRAPSRLLDYELALGRFI